MERAIGRRPSDIIEVTNTGDLVVPRRAFTPIARRAAVFGVFATLLLVAQRAAVNTARGAAQCTFGVAFGYDGLDRLRACPPLAGDSMVDHKQCRTVSDVTPLEQGGKG